MEQLGREARGIQECIPEASLVPSSPSFSSIALWQSLLPASGSACAISDPIPKLSDFPTR